MRREVADAESQTSSHGKIDTNRLMLDLRQRVQWQSRVIAELKRERDRLTTELASRLVYVEAQLRREQKHIESMLTEKDQLIEFQALQIESLKLLLADTPYAGRRGSGRKQGMLSKRYSVALDECMRDSGVVSRASPVIVCGDSEFETSRPRSHHLEQHSRTLSLPDLPYYDASGYEWVSRQVDCYTSVHEYGPTRQWTTSDCDSEHSDSLDSGISSPSMKARNQHQTGRTMLEVPRNSSPTGVETASKSSAPRRSSSMAEKVQPPSYEDSKVQSGRRGSALGNFIHRTFSSSSSHLEKIKSEPECLGCRRDSLSKLSDSAQPPKGNRFISSANRNFGTNHRSVTKPRDIKFRKLFKFRRRAQNAAAEANGVCNGECCMTV